MNRMLICLALGLALIAPAEAQRRTKYAVTVTLAGTGSGTVTSSPAGISCPGTCSFQFNSGTDVVLTATPASGSTFSGWTGDCAGTGNCSLPLLASAKSVTATFASSGGGGSGGGGSQPTITEVYFSTNADNQLTLTALGSNFTADTTARLGSLPPLVLDGTNGTGYTVFVPNDLLHGDYLLTLTNAAGIATWQLTYPAVGPEGPQGPPGPDGLPGAQGEPGPPGPDTRTYDGQDNLGLGGANGVLGRLTTGSSNVAFGSLVATNLTEGSDNLAIGRVSLLGTSTGNRNIALGTAALQYNESGSDNIGIGMGALYFSNGNRNIGLGVSSGNGLVNGSNNIAIASALPGDPSNTIRIGDSHQAAFVAGIRGVSPEGSIQQVVINENGQLGSITINPIFLNGESTGIGNDAYDANSADRAITAYGARALASNTTGYQNVAIGTWALQSNESGFENTAIGFNALGAVSDGYQNTAIGFGANLQNSIQNTAVGYEALANNASVQNTAVGFVALGSSTTGVYNTAVGTGAASSFTTGSFNTAVGWSAMGVLSGYRNTEGDSNTAIGIAAGSGLDTGSRNIFLGANSGTQIHNGSNNIQIGNPGVDDESGVIRIGERGTHANVFIAGITDVVPEGVLQQVVINPDGQLGTTALSNTSGCSVSQQQNYAVISCADGSTATIAGEGVILVYPESGVGPPSEPTIYPTGEIVVVDSAGTIFGRFGGSVGRDGLFGFGFYSSISFPLVGEMQLEVHVFNDPANQNMVFNHNETLTFLEPDCQGVELVRNYGRYYPTYSRGKWWIVDADAEELPTVLVKSRFLAGESPFPDDDRCENIDSVEIDGHLKPIRGFVPPSEWSSAVYPMSVIQLP